MQETSVDLERAIGSRDSPDSYKHEPSDTWHTPESAGRAKLFIHSYKCIMCMLKRIGKGLIDLHDLSAISYACITHMSTQVLTDIMCYI